MYVQGENPAMSDPDANHAREALAALDHLVVQDIFLTETAYLADVILPASAFPEKTGTFTNTDRLVQMGRQAIDPPGDATPGPVDHPADRQPAGSATGTTATCREVFDEMRHTMPSIAGITWDRLEREHAVTYPCVKEGDPGEPVVFVDDFPREGGKARFVPADIIPAAERPDAEYPMVLITGRQLEHWHTGSMTRRATVLDAIEPDPVALIHPLDLAAMGAQAGRRGDDRVAPRQGGAVCARRRRHAARRGVRAVLLLRGGDQQADQRRARPVREDPGVQVLRDPRRARRRSAAAGQLRRRPGAGTAGRVMNTPERLRRSPSRGRRQWPGGAGSTAFAWWHRLSI